MKKFGLKKSVQKAGVFLFICLFVVSGLATPSWAFLRVGYIETRYPAGTDWYQFEQIYNGSYSHIISAFWKPDLKPNRQSPTDVDIIEVGATSQILGATLADNTTKIVSRARANNVKIMVSIGGSEVPFGDYVTISRSANLKSLFIAKILDKVNDYDGIDFNWEGMEDSLLTKDDRTVVELLAKDLATAVKAQYPEKIVSVTLSTLHWLTMGFTCDFINSDEVDFASHMSYDFYTADNYQDKPIGPFRNQETAWLYDNGSDPSFQIERSVWGALHYLQEQGCVMQKILAGIPFYASDKVQTWNDVRNGGWNYFHDDPSFPYLEKSNTADETKGLWINDPQAIERKIIEYKNLGLGGVMVWQIGQEGPTADLTEVIRDTVSGGDGSYHAPHDAANDISCNVCHSGPLPDTAAARSAICETCHDGVSAPLALTHSNAVINGNPGWSATCLDCHNPHFHYQLVNIPDLYLVTGTISDSPVYSQQDNTSSFHYSSLTVIRSNWATPAEWGSKTSSGRGLILAAVTNPNINFEIVSANDTQITVNGEMPVSLAGEAFGIIYGQLLKSVLATPNSGNREVKFFDNTGTNSFADGDTSYNGICEVCHTLTAHFRNDGSGPDQNHTNIDPVNGLGGENCTDVCHPHASGFGSGGQ